MEIVNCNQINLTKDENNPPKSSPSLRAGQAPSEWAGQA